MGSKIQTFLQILLLMVLCRCFPMVWFGNKKKQQGPSIGQPKSETQSARNLSLMISKAFWGQTLFNRLFESLK